MTLRKSSVITVKSHDKPPSGWAPRKLSRVFDCYIEKRQ